MPNTITPSISSEVAIGRRMKGSEMLTCAYPPSARRSGGVLRLRFDPNAVGEAVLAVDDDVLAGLQPLADHGDAVLDGGDLDGAALDRVVLADDIGEIAVRSLLDGLRRHRGDAAAHLQHQAHVDERAGP